MISSRHVHVTISQGVMASLIEGSRITTVLQQETSAVGTPCRKDLEVILVMADAVNFPEPEGLPTHLGF